MALIIEDERKIKQQRTIGIIMMAAGTAMLAWLMFKIIKAK